MKDFFRAEIKITPPGPEAKKVIEKDSKYIATSTKCLPVVGKRGYGIMVEDVDGNTYLDFTSGIGVLNTGHCHPKIVKAVQEQAENLIHFAGTDFYYDIQATLAQRLTEITPGDHPKKVFFTNSGAESNEAAIKLSKFYTERKQFLAFIGAFHGRTAAAGALTASKPVHKNRFFPLMPGVNHVPYPNPYRNPFGIDGYEEPEALSDAVISFIEDYVFETYLPPEEVAALFFEPVQGEGGYIVPPSDFAPKLKKLTEEHEILFVSDEVQAGFGRTGKMFAIEHYGVVPDIIAIAKGMGSGLPIGAIVFDAKLDFSVKGAHSNTYGGNLVASASALATIDVIQEERLVENAAQMGAYLKKRLLELKEKYDIIGDVRGLGLMLATEFVKDRKTKAYAVKERDKILEGAYKNGLLLLPCGTSGIRYIPPLTVKEDAIDIAMEILEGSIKKV